MNNSRVLVGAIVMALVLVACGGSKSGGTRETKIETDFSEKGTVTKEVVTVNEKIKSELHRVLDGVVVEGKGMFKDANENLAKSAALTMALNDLAKKAGQVLIEEDTTIYNNEVKSIIRQRASNVVAGYKVMLDVYDPETQTAEIVVRQEGERIASQIERFITSE